ncbi:protein argonaute-2 [Drosophila tropicalis]|uniref:protein argonaute-2 n=1 Tax=Drosophila tropicalis TaxID=46794 RepID=UPI0035AC017A
MGKKNKYAPPAQPQQQREQPAAGDNAQPSPQGTPRAQPSQQTQSQGGSSVSQQAQGRGAPSQVSQQSQGSSVSQQAQGRGAPSQVSQQSQGGGKQRGQQGAWGGQGGQQGAWGGQGGQQGAWGGQQGTGPQGGYQQRGQQKGGGAVRGGYQQRGPQGTGSQGGNQQRGPQGTVPQGTVPQGGNQQRGQQGGGDAERGGYQKHGQQSRPQGGAALPPLPDLPAGSIKRGTIGTPGQVAVNYLNVDMEKMPAKAYHYDVKITPERPKKFFRDAFEQFRIAHLGNVAVAFDGRASCFSVDKLETAANGADVQVADRNGRTLNYNVQIKSTASKQVDLNSLRSYMKDKIYDKPMQAMQCLEVVLATPCHKKTIRAGRSFFKSSVAENRLNLGDGYECLIGLYQAFVLGDQPFVNVDISHKSFPIGLSMLEYIENYGINSRYPTKITATTTLSQSRTCIEQFVKGINIVYEPPECFNSAPRVYKVNGLSPQSAEDQKFELEDKREMTVKEYFRGRNYDLKYPKLHCLHVGLPAKKIYLPIELCRIEEGQALNRKDGANQVSQMIKYAATSTNQRKEKIMNFLKYIQHNQDPTISRFGIRIVGDFITVHTRTLSPPQVEYKNKYMTSVRNGSWRMDNAKFLELPTKNHKWAVLYFHEQRGLIYNEVADFARRFRSQALTTAVNLEEQAEILPFTNDRDLDNRFVELKRDKFDLVIVIIPNRGTSYDTIKQKAELTHGILTQCIKQITVQRKLNPQLIGNLLLKVNSKLNGINHKLKDDPRTRLVNAMYLGADVTHPSPDQREIPSVVGVAASHDLYGASYNMQYRLQRSTAEEIEDMEGIVAEHLRIYQHYHKKYPDHIIYYRDGVSDGQFPKIKALELRGIYAACAKLKIKPHLCCAIVVKRHHTRFFPKGEPSQYNKFNNVNPGTVVDRTIVHPNEMQFFMVSHQSIQGTAKPTRYNIIENTGNLDIDLLQQLTYNLCHMFPRCTRSVSYPTPAYLAHLVAARGRVYLAGARLVNSPQDEYQKRLINAAFMKSNPMYFV